MGLQFYVMPCLAPLIIGLGLLLADPKSAYVRLLALLTLKPVVGTSLWLLSTFLRGRSFRDSAPLIVVPVFYEPIWLTWQTLLPLPLIGLGLTAAILWRCRATLRTIPLFTLMLLLTLDTLRWGSTYLVDLTRFSGFTPLVNTAMAMPSVFATVALLLWGWSHRSDLQPEAS